MLKRLLFTASILAFLTLLTANELPDNTLQQAAQAWLAQNPLFQLENAAPDITASAPLENAALLPLRVFTLAPRGYLVLTTDTDLPPIIAFSPDESFDSSAASPLHDLLAARGNALWQQLLSPGPADAISANRRQWQSLLGLPTRASAPSTPDQIIIPNFLTTWWAQGLPFNYFYPSNSLSEENHALTGCVQTAAAQLMAYYQWPPHGHGTATQNVRNAEITATLKADFSWPYDWQAMLKTHSGLEGSTPSENELKVARLFFDLGVMNQAEYGMEATNTVSSAASYGLAKHCYYSAGTELSTARGLYAALKTSMQNRRPAIVSYQKRTEGHSFLVSGLATLNGADYYYLNYGWGPNLYSGWYLLNDGIDDTVISSGIVNIMPLPVAVFSPLTAPQAPAFTLAWDFPACHTATAFRLSVDRGSRIRTIVNDSIPGTDRSILLKNQPTGTATYYLEAQVNGNWQAISDGLTVTITSTVATPPTLTASASRFSVNSGSSAALTLTVNGGARSLSVTTSRPDLFQPSYIQVSGNGSAWNLNLTSTAGLFGTARVWITATADNGAQTRLEITAVVANSHKLFWHRNYQDAQREALATGRKILLVAGRDSCANTNYFRLNLCEQTQFKKLIQNNFVLWYADCDTDDDFYAYKVDDSDYLPFCSILSPFDQTGGFFGLNGPQSDNAYLTFLQSKTAGTLTISPANTTINNPDGAPFSLTITSDDDWQVYADPKDITLSVTGGSGNGTVTGTLRRNPSQEQRQAIVTVYHNDHLASAWLSQAPSAPYLDIPDTLSVSCIGGSLPFPVDSSIQWLTTWDETAAPWLSTASHTGQGYNDLLLNVEPNMTGHSRSVIITIAGDSLQSSCLLTQTCIADETDTSLFRFTVNDHTATVTDFLGDASCQHVVIPDSYNGNPVTAIGDYAFNNQNNITSIVVPDSVTAIGDYAFYNLNNLTSLYLSHHLATIGEGAFMNDESLENLIVPDSVTAIGSSAFSFCTGLKSVTLPDSLNAIGENAFYACYYIKKLNIPSALREISASAFSYLWSFLPTLPPRLTSIGPAAFNWSIVNGQFFTLTVPATVTAIADDVFNNSYAIVTLRFDGPKPALTGTSRQLTNVEPPFDICAWPGFNWTNGESFGGCPVTILPGANPPAISRTDGSSSSHIVDSATIALSGASGCTIHYTLDGSTPTADSPVYTAPLTVDEFTPQCEPGIICLQARLFRGNEEYSGVSYREFTFQRTLKYYDLTVINGSGSGTYLEGDTVHVATDIPPTLRFLSWTPADLLSPLQASSPEFDFIIPRQDVTLTAQTAPRVLSLDLNQLTLSALSSTTSLQLTSTENWNATVDATWLVVTPASGSGDATLTLSATANDSTEPRTATLTLSAPNCPAAVCNVTQQPLCSQQLPFQAGWHLVTLLIEPTPESAAKLTDATLYQLTQDGSAWCPATLPPAPGQALFLYNYGRETAAERNITGNAAASRPLARPSRNGWHLCGLTQTAPAPAWVQAAWQWNGSCYQPVPAGEPLQAGQAYWLLCR